MLIHYYDGGTLLCYHIVFCGDTLIADDIYEVRLDEIESIEAEF